MKSFLLLACLLLIPVPALSTRYQPNPKQIQRARKHLRKRAKKKQIPFDLTIDDLERLWDSPCGFCGGAIRGISPARLSSKRGWVYNNTLQACGVCVKSKGSLELSEWLGHSRRVINYCESLLPRRE